MKETISVIVPVYNVEAYLPECLISILSQSYKNLEIILINDGSTDHSGVICDEFSRKDSRIHVIHQENRGAGAAKNAGLRAATGEYLSFVDSDDFLEPDAYSHMLAILEDSRADAVQCGYREVHLNGKTERFSLAERREFNCEDYLLRYTTDWTCSLLWDKLYKRALFHGIYFEEGHIVDDEFFTYRGMMNAGRIVYEPIIVYNYRKRKSSVTAKPEYRERTIMDKMDYLIQRRLHINQRYPELKQAFDRHYLAMLTWLSVDPYASEACLLRLKKLLKAYFAESNHTKIGLRQRLVLFHIQFYSISKLLQRRNAPAFEELSQYFD